MKIAKQRLKEIIKEELENSQNEGRFMDTIKGMGKQIGAGVGMDTDPESKKFLQKVSAVITRIDPRRDLFPKYGENIAIPPELDGAKEVLDVLEKSIVFKDAEEAKEKMSHAEQGKQMLDAWENSPSGKQADEVGNIYSPNTGLMYALGTADDYFDAVIYHAKRFMSQLKRGKTPDRQIGDDGYRLVKTNESKITKSALKSLIAEELTKAEKARKKKLEKELDDLKHK